MGLDRMTVIAKKSLQYYGTFGLTAYLCGTVFVDRSNKVEAATRLNTVAKTLKEKRIKLWVLPEGTRNTNKEVDMLPFKKGAFHVAINASLPILPIVTSRHDFLDESVGLMKPGVGRITVLPLVWPGDKDVESLMEEVRGAMLEEFTNS